jgi:hypothetical protein
MRSIVAVVAIAGVLAFSSSCKKFKPVPLTAPDAPLSAVQKTSVLPALNTWRATEEMVGTVYPGSVEGSTGYEVYGACATATGATLLSLPSNMTSRGGAARTEADVKEGKVRIYVAPKVTKAIVTESDIAKAGYSYADATPGHPVKLEGELLSRGGSFGFVFEVLEPVKGLRWRIYN